MNTRPILSFTVEGEPKTAGSKTSGVVTRKVGDKRVPVINPKTGLPKTFTKDSSESAGKSWRSHVAGTARDARDAAGLGVIHSPLAVSMTFYKPRSPGDYSRRDGSLLPSKPLHPAKRPDVLKLARAVEDALTGVVWADDAQIVVERLEKRYCAPTEPQRVEVSILTLSESRVDESPQVELALT